MDKDSRTWAMAAHLSGLIGMSGGIAGFVGPLVVWLVKREADPFVEAHAREALNFHLSVLIYIGLAFVLAVITLGIGLIALVPIGLIAAVGWLVVIIVAARHASRGDHYRYPLTFRFVS